MRHSWGFKLKSLKHNYNNEILVMGTSLLSKSCVIGWKIQKLDKKKHFLRHECNVPMPGCMLKDWIFPWISGTICSSHHIHACSLERSDEIAPKNMGTLWYMITFLKVLKVWQICFEMRWGLNPRVKMKRRTWVVIGWPCRWRVKGWDPFQPRT